MWRIRTEIVANNTPVEQVTDFNYLGLETGQGYK